MKTILFNNYPRRFIVSFDTFDKTKRKFKCYSMLTQTDLYLSTSTNLYFLVSSHFSNLSGGFCLSPATVNFRNKTTVY